MAGFWKRLRKRALLRTPASHELSGYLECYAAGYARGLRDQRSGCAGWEDTTQKIATQLVSNRSVVEAGCWLAGMHQGRHDAAEDRAVLPIHIYRAFCASWENAAIAEYALQSAPGILGRRGLLAAVCKPQPRISLREKVAVKWRLGVLDAASPENRDRKRTARRRQGRVRQSA